MCDTQPHRWVAMLTPQQMGAIQIFQNFLRVPGAPRCNVPGWCASGVVLTFSVTK